MQAGEGTHLSSPRSHQGLPACRGSLPSRLASSSTERGGRRQAAAACQAATTTGSAPCPVPVQLTETPLSPQGCKGTLGQGTAPGGEQRSTPGIPTRNKAVSKGKAGSPQPVWARGHTPAPQPSSPNATHREPRQLLHPASTRVRCESSRLQKEQLPSSPGRFPGQVLPAALAAGTAGAELALPSADSTALLLQLPLLPSPPAQVWDLQQQGMPAPLEGHHASPGDTGRAGRSPATRSCMLFPNHRKPIPS